MKKIIAFLLLVITVFTMGTTAFATSGSWKQNSKGWWYEYTDGSYAQNWAKVGNKWYYFNGKGYMQTGWIQDGGKWYYLNASGAMTTGWQKVSGSWYYMNSAGVMQTGWVKDGGKWYYLNNSGIMTTGWQKISGKWYYMNRAGIMQTGWQNLGGKKYYFNKSGAMVTGTQTINGKTYTFGNNGALIAEKETQTINTVKNEYWNPNNHAIDLNCVSVKPYHIYYSGSSLIAECYVLNGFSHSVYAVKIQNLTIKNQHGTIAGACFGELKNLVIAPMSYAKWTFRFPSDCVLKQGADLTGTIQYVADSTNRY